MQWHIAVKALVLLALTISPAQAQVVTEFSTGIPPGASPMGIVTGPDGNLWFAETGISRIGRITPLGVPTEIQSGITASSQPVGISNGPNGSLWFTEFNGAGRIGQITAVTGAVTEFSSGISPGGASPYGIAAGADGNVWFTELAGRIGRITFDGVITEFSAGISAGASPSAITLGPDGNMWFTEEQGDRIARITPLGVITEFGAGITQGAAPSGITSGPDGNLWFTETGIGKIGRFNPVTGVVSEFGFGMGTGALPRGIVAGPDGNLWFTDSAVSENRIGRITPQGVITEFSQGISPGAGVFGITVGPDNNLWFTETGGIAKIGRMTIPFAPMLLGIASRKVHGAEGNFDLPLAPNPSDPTTEPRQGPFQTIVFTFDKPIDGVTIAISEGTATPDIPDLIGNDLIVTLTGVINQQYVTISLTNVSSPNGGIGGVGLARIGFLAGDVNGNRVVSLSDVGLVNAQLAQGVSASNFLRDVNVSGTLSLADMAIANANLTRALPPP